MDGEPHQATLLEMVPLPAGGGNAERIIKNSRNSWGRERRIVEGRIERFLAREKPKKNPQEKKSAW